MPYPSLTHSGTQVALVLSRYARVLESADLSSVTRPMFEQLHIMTRNSSTAGDPREVLLSASSFAIEEHDDLVCVVEALQNMGVDLTPYETDYSTLEGLLALDRTLEGFGLLQCTALLERLEEVTILSEDDLDDRRALDAVYDRIIQRIF